MTKHEVSILEPGIRNTNTGENPPAKNNRYVADVYVKPPFRPGPALGRFISGNDFDYSGVGFTEVRSSEEGTHLTVTTAVGAAATAEAVEKAIGRFGEYLDVDPMQLGALGVKFAQDPIITRHA